MSIESLNAFSMDFFSLKGKTAIVTGGNSGLGQAFAMALAKAGANIFIPSFVKDNGETKEMIEKQGIEEGDQVEVDFDSGMIYNKTKGTEYKGQAFPEFMQKIISNGGLINYINNAK